MKTKSVNPKETIMQWVFTVCACVSILAVALICLFLFANGLPTIAKIGPLQFLLGLAAVVGLHCPQQYMDG